MKYALWHGFCLAAEDAALFPPDAAACPQPAEPLVFLVAEDGFIGCGYRAVDTLSAIDEKGISALLPAQAGVGELARFVEQHGASVLNTTFQNAFPYLLAQAKRKTGYRVTLVGLGDVGGTALTALKLLGHEIREIRIYDPYAPMMARYELELNQVLSCGTPMPKITPCPEDALFDCDVFIFTASRSVPQVGSDVKDVRMVQYEANRDMLRTYAQMAREAHFTGLFCQVSDPVDHLARVVFLQSNRTADGVYDFGGLLPEQVQGFGLGVMAARAAYFAEKEGIDFSAGRVYGPHGADLIVANSSGESYNDTLSARMTEWAKTANLRVRELGFKPYIAPGLSSAALSILALLRGETHYGAVPIDGAYFGCRSRMTERGLCVQREPICAKLLERIEKTHRLLKEFDYHV